MNDTVKEEHQDPRGVFAILVQRGNIADVLGFLASAHKMRSDCVIFIAKKNGVI
jgi:hypothetical protein